MLTASAQLAGCEHRILMTDWTSRQAQAAAHHDLLLEVPGAIVQFDA